MMQREKCTEEVKLRIPESLLLDITRLANIEERTVSEFIRHLVEDGIYGRGRILDRIAFKRHEFHGEHEGR